MITKIQQLAAYCAVRAYIHTYTYTYTGCPGVNVPDFGRMFLTLKYTDITQNTYVYPKLNGNGDNGERSLKV